MIKNEFKLTFHTRRKYLVHWATVFMTCLCPVVCHLVSGCSTENQHINPPGDPDPALRGRSRGGLHGRNRGGSGGRDPPTHLSDPCLKQVKRQAMRVILAPHHIHITTIPYLTEQLRLLTLGAIRHKLSRATPLDPLKRTPMYTETPPTW